MAVATPTITPDQTGSVRPGEPRFGPAPIKGTETSTETEKMQLSAAPPSARDISPEKSGRSSFASVRENESDLAQAFTSTKVSSYSRDSEHAIEDHPSPSTGSMATQTQFMAPVTHPDSRLHGCWFPAVAADSFQGWKQIGVKGRQASKSFGDLQSLRIVWSTPPATPKVAKRPDRAAPGQAAIERLPLELLGPIIDLLVLDIPPNGISARNVDLMSLLLSSRTLHTATLNALYKNITIPHSRIFRKFLSHISANEELGTIVRRLDFSHFNPTTLFSTASERATTQNLTPQTLLRCLELTPYLREFLAQEYVDDELRFEVVQKLFFGLHRLEAVDFTGCSSAGFKEAMTLLADAEWPETLALKRVSLHRCINVPPNFFDALLPRLPYLTHLDLTGTRVTIEALQSIPHTARISHLSLAKCKFLTAEGVIDFLANHPAVKGSLIYLNLASDARSHQLLDVEDVSLLLPILPVTLRSLSLNGSKMDRSHIDLLRPLTKHLEELALGRCLKIRDINRLFVPDENSDDKDDVSSQLEWVPHSLKYLDISDYPVADLRDFRDLFASDISIIKPYSAPLEVLEVADGIYKALHDHTALQKQGWAATELGSRTWVVRKSGPDPGARDSGQRSWKMGASFWGMRKIPVAVAEVGGMYGSYMFKRKL